MKILYREPAAYWHFVGWGAFSLGFTVDFSCPNVELHLPFGFFRLGWVKVYESDYYVVKK